MRKIIPSLFRNRNLRRGRAGQSLVDFALLTSFISLAVVQEMHYLGEIVDCEMVRSNAAFVVAYTVDHNANLTGAALNQACMAAVHTYLTTTSTWQGIDANLASSQAASIYQGIYLGLYGQYDPNGGAEFNN